MSARPWPRHCWKCGHADGSPLVVDDNFATCCTCCEGEDGSRGPGLNDDGGDW